MTFFQAALMLAALLCAVVAGLLFTFAVVVMPGIRSLNDGDFIRAFQVMDRVIQRNQPLFVLTWIGAVLAVLITAALGPWALDGAGRVLAIGAALLYLLGVQAPTFIVNIPLNNRLQALDVGTMSESIRAQARRQFESRWNRWNVFRAVCAGLTAILLIILLERS